MAMSTARKNKVKKILYERSKLCAFCHSELKLARATLDHIVPISKGGGNSIENLQLMHNECNNIKADNENSVLQLMGLKVKPYRRYMIVERLVELKSIAVNERLNAVHEIATEILELIDQEGLVQGLVKKEKDSA